jgi:hypothetical protein
MDSILSLLFACSAVYVQTEMGNFLMLGDVAVLG